MSVYVVKPGQVFTFITIIKFRDFFPIQYIPVQFSNGFSQYLLGHFGITILSIKLK